MPLTEIDTNSTQQQIAKFLSIATSGNYTRANAIKLRGLKRIKPIAARLFLFEGVNFDLSFAGIYKPLVSMWRITLFGIDLKSGTAKDAIRAFLTNLINFMDNRGIDSVYFQFDENNIHPIMQTLKDLTKQEWVLDDGGATISTRNFQVEIINRNSVPYVQKLIISRNV